MTSQDQIDANRLNAKKSTGPRTPGGRKRSSQNALKHGLTAEKLVTSGEDAGAYQERLDALIEHWQPVGPSETTLVHQMAAASWRIDRAMRTEAMNYPSTILDWRNAEIFELALRYGTAAERSFYKAMAMLKQFQEMRSRLEPAEAEEEAQPASTAAHPGDGTP